MKFPWKQTAIRILCLLILAIPTCIAIVYYCAKNYAASARYTVIIHTAEGETIDVAEDEIGTVVAAVKKMNKKMKPAMTGRIDVYALPGEYYDISVFEKDNPISSYRYYFSVFNDEWTLVEDITAYLILSKMFLLPQFSVQKMRLYVLFVSDTGRSYDCRRRGRDPQASRMAL